MRKISHRKIFRHLYTGLLKSSSLNFKSFTLALLLSIPFIYLEFAGAETPEEKGLAIAIEADRRDTGWKDLVSHMTMTLRNREGKESQRKLRIKILEVAGDGDKSLMVFDRPRDLKGTALLTYSHKSGTDDQWLFLPALKRVKRISSANKTGPFMGSEFTYEDMTSPEIEKFTYKYIKDAILNDLECFIVERYPIDKNSGYKREVVWIDKKEYRPWKIEFYDRKDSHLKTLTISNYNQYINNYWRPDTSYMENHQTGKSTTLDYKDYRFRVGLNSKIFKSNKLHNIR